MNENKEYEVANEELKEVDMVDCKTLHKIRSKIIYNKKLIIIKDLLIKFHLYVSSLSTIKYIFFMSILSFLIAMPLSLLAEPINFEAIIPDWSAYFYLNIFLQAVLLMPFLETIVYQFIPLIILKNIKWIKKYKVLHILISALYFGISHYNWGGIGKVILAFWSGMILAYSYVLYSNKKKKPFLIVFTIHALHNFMATFGISMILMLLQAIFI